MVRYYLTPVRMADIKKSSNNKCWRGCGEKELLYTVGGNVNWYRHSMEVLQKTTNRITYGPAIPFLGLEQKKIPTNLKRYIHPDIYSSIIYNGQDLRTI